MASRNLASTGLRSAGTCPRRCSPRSSSEGWEGVEGVEEGELGVGVGAAEEERVTHHRPQLHRELGSLGVHVANVHAALVVEQYLVRLAVGEHAEVVLVGLLVVHHRLDQEGVEVPRDRLDFGLLAHALVDPRFRLLPGLVDGHEARLAAALDELVGLGNELGVLDTRVGRLEGVPVGPLLHEHARHRDADLVVRVRPEVLRQQLLAAVLADRFGGHGEGGKRRDGTA